MAVIFNNPIKTISVLMIFFTLQTFYFYVADAQVSNIINEIVPSCIFGVESVSYYLFTRELMRGEEIYANDTIAPFREDKDVRFLVHGFLSEANTTNNYELIGAMLDKEDVNIVALDWKNASCNSGLSITDLLAYGAAVNNVPTVGEDMANFTIRLIQHYGLQLNTTIFIGHSLGAHVASYASKTLQERGIGTVSEMIGLDPAGPAFSSRPCSQRLCKSDADFVQVFHTSFFAGISEAIGHDDFYFNGGMIQPGCIFTSCSHSRATQYLTSSVAKGCFMGTPWKYRTDETIPTEKCTPNICATPGFKAREQKARGTFYVRTSSSYPFCK